VRTCSGIKISDLLALLDPEKRETAQKLALACAFFAGEFLVQPIKGERPFSGLSAAITRNFARDFRALGGLNYANRGVKWPFPGTIPLFFAETPLSGLSLVANRA
jgi:hypothetical protein